MRSSAAQPRWLQDEENNLGEMKMKRWRLKANVVKKLAFL
jgi:hypothetical protein